MKICLVMGTRPNFMKISALIEPLEEYKMNYFIVHTGQHFDENMSKNVLSDLSINDIDYHIKPNFDGQITQFSNIMIEFDKICKKEKPDLVIVPGDVNSTLACALVAAKSSIKIAHLEAGLRSFDKDMPEEVNRLLTDHLSDYLFTTETSAQFNLMNEGVDKNKIIFSGNTMIDTLLKNIDKAKQLSVYKEYNLSKRKYCLVTMHRPSNVDSQSGLKKIVKMLNELSRAIQVIFPVHPRTKKKMNQEGLSFNDSVLCIDPLSYIDFLSLLNYAFIVLTDSGGVQEETTYLGVQCVTFRENTERPVTIDVGTNHLANCNVNNTLKIIESILNGGEKKGKIPQKWDGHAGRRTIDYIRKIDLS
jgi:UDP-N-acetylglucosamine 2-epimerase (non-hydrolysing)